MLRFYDIIGYSMCCCVAVLCCDAGSAIVVVVLVVRLVVGFRVVSVHDVCCVCVCCVVLLFVGMLPFAWFRCVVVSLCFELMLHCLIFVLCWRVMRCLCVVLR